LKIIKKFSRFFFVLEERYTDQMRDSVLVVEGSFMSLDSLLSVIRKVREQFPSATINVLAFNDKKNAILSNFTDVKVCIPNPGIRARKHVLAVQLYKLLCQGPRFVILSSLDISLLAIALIFSRNNAFILAKELYQVRIKTVSEIIKNKKGVILGNHQGNVRFSRIVLSKIISFFVIIAPAKIDNFQTTILLEDNGYTSVEHILNSIKEINQVFINPKISLLTFRERKHYFQELIPLERTFTPKNSTQKYSLALRMLSLRSGNFRYIILTTLDASPLIASLLFPKAKVILYNKWGQWWTIDLITLGACLKNILALFSSVVMFVFLLTSFVFIFLPFTIRLTFIRPRLDGFQEELT